MELQRSRIRRSIARTMTLLACIAQAVVLGAGCPDTFTVTKTEDTIDGWCTVWDCSLRDAVYAANSNPGKDRIVVPAGQYPSGGLDLTDDVEIVGDGAGPTLVSCEGPYCTDYVFAVSSGVEVDISGLAATDALAGIRNQGTLVLTDSALDGNYAVGLVNEGMATVRGSSASGNGPGYQELAVIGAGVWNTGTLLLVDSVVRENWALWQGPGPAPCFGAGVYNEGGTVTIVQTSVTGSKGLGDMCGSAGIWNTGLGTVIESTVSGNASGPTGGGGILNWGTLEVRNSTVGETAEPEFEWSESVAISNDGSLHLIHTTVAGYPGSPTIESSANIELVNSLVDGSCSGEPGATWASEGGNLESPGNTCGLGDPSDQVNIPDPMMGPLADNGGPTETHALLPGSPALDRATEARCLETDQRGIPRPQGAGCDVGAFELEAGTAIH